MTTKTTAAVRAFVTSHDSESLTAVTVESVLSEVCERPQFKELIVSLVDSEAFSKELGLEFAAAGAVEGLSACRRLRGCLNLPLGSFFSLLAEMVSAFNLAVGAEWSAFGDRVLASELNRKRLLDVLLGSAEGEFYHAFAEGLVETNPHAIYPTSSYRESAGHVVSSDDGQTIEAVMSARTFTSIVVLDNALDPQQLTLKETYAPLGRCVCLVDQNVDIHYGDAIADYFRYHDIHLDKLVYRAMEVDKGIRTVEQMLADFKRLGVSRNEPVLIVGGGVLADTGGLACALYHRNTPYVMLSTSIVSGIDAGPSPRTCCDGFGYKNLFGAYHAPVLSITDRSFFKTLHAGWLRHGIAEIIKMATVKNAALFSDLEQAGPDLISTRFGTLDCAPDADIVGRSQRILGAALQSYVEAEYDNLYETHQCRPHAYGHTWSPGFEIAAGLLHGHAVAIGMGFGAYLSHRAGWIAKEEMHRILRLIVAFDLSLWHDILLDRGILWAAQEKIFQKRGGNLVAPVPKGGIGRCGYLNSLSRDDLDLAIAEYQQVCADYPRQGRGIEPLCSDVGLEDPSTVADDEPVETPNYAPLPPLGV